MLDAYRKVEVIISDANTSDDVDDAEPQVKKILKNVVLKKIKINITVGTDTRKGIALTFYQAYFSIVHYLIFGLNRSLRVASFLNLKFNPRLML